MCASRLFFSLNRYQQATQIRGYGFLKEFLTYTVVAPFESKLTVAFGVKKVIIDYIYEQILLTWQL